MRKLMCQYPQIEMHNKKYVLCGPVCQSFGKILKTIKRRFELLKAGEF
jgi:hypothetical protein